MSISQETLSTKNILIVDETENNLRILAEYLSEAGYRIMIAVNGQKAISIAERLRPDLILLDVMMPNLKGFAVCNCLKNNPLTQDIPIIFMTALSDTQHKIKGLTLGGADYITKPFEKSELLARVKTHLSLSHLCQVSVRDAERHRVMLGISDRIRKPLDLNLILDTAIAEIGQLIDCDFVGIMALQEQQVSLKAHNLVGLSSKDQDVFLPYQYFCPSQPVYQAYLQGHIEFQEHLEPALPLPAARRRLIVPIVIDNLDNRILMVDLAEPAATQADDNYLFGWLMLDRSSSEQPWQPNEISLLEELKIHLAIGLKQSLLHQQLAELALLDSLTHIYNRRYFNQQLEKEWGRLKRAVVPLSLVMCDIDYFKIYNDTYGHQQGDRCLQQVAQTIASVLKRPGDVLARYGGGEFAVILPQTTQAGAAQVAEEIRSAVKNLAIPHQNSLVDSVVTLSLGVAATIPHQEDNTQLLLEAADLALYQAKKRGRDCVAVYPEAISQAKNRDELDVRWVKRLRVALEQNLFSLYTQSIVPLKENSSCSHFEVLLRLTDTEDTVVLPGDFLGIAESYFLMTDIDTWVINNLFAILENHATKHAVAGHPWKNYRFSVNLSGSSLNNQSFLQFLQDKLQQCTLPPELFCFEITESVAVSNLEQTIEFINTLKEMGCSFALDDFGKGVSSLTYLKNLPVDYLKIDGSFIRELNANPTSKIMVEAINHIAEGIGLETVAEFVEDEQILRSVKDLNVDYAQGFHFSRPEALVDQIG